jgi:succinyl-CoA synthetase alpha subunit
MTVIGKAASKNDADSSILRGCAGQAGAEEEAAPWIKDNFTKPVAAFIAGATAPKGR